MDDHMIIEFSGDAGTSANIDLSIPLPGAHSGRRLIEIVDIPSEAWSDEAWNSGADWQVEFGFERDVDEFDLVNPDLLIDEFYTGLYSATSFRSLMGIQSELRRQDFDLMLNVLRSATLQDAHEMLRERGNLREWRGSLDIKSLPIPRPGPSLTTSSSLQVQRQAVASPTSQESDALMTKQIAVGEAVNAAFQTAISQINEGKVQIPVTKWGGALTMIPIDLTEESQPRLFIVQVFGVSSFLGDYGLGRTVKTLTLLPGEEMTISTRTWRATTETRSESSSIVDSYDESSSERFADTVLTETTDTYTQSKSSNWHAEAEVKASWGWGSASASGGGGGESSSSTEEFAKSVDESVAEHAQEASSHRENTVTSSSESSEESGTETVVERTIKNINVKRTLNFVFRELNNAYITKTHLKDIRIAFTNGRSGSWRETPLSDLATFINELIDDRDTGRQVLQWILSYVATVFDKDDTPHRVLEKVVLDQCGSQIESISDAQPGENCEWELPPLDLSFYYRFKRGDKTRNFAIGQEDEEHPVEGVLLREREVTLRTDSVVVEALLGVNNALDEYSEDLQVETIREQKLANDREALAQRLVSQEDAAKAELFRQVFFEDVEAEEEAA